MIILKKLHLINFLSHKDTELDFEPNSKILIDGHSGSGKSAIVEGLVWSLYGRGRADNRSLIRRGEKSAKVEIILEKKALNEDVVYRFKIERSITASGKHSLKISEAKAPNTDFRQPFIYKPSAVNGVKEIQDMIEKDLLKSSYTLFVNSIVYPQESVDSFVHQTAKKRKDIILEIVNASQYDDFYIQARDKLREINEAGAKAEVAMTTLGNIVEQDEDSVKDIVKIRADEKKDKMILMTYVNSIKEAQSEIRDIEIKVLDYKGKEAALANLQNHMVALAKSKGTAEATLSFMNLPENVDSEKKQVAVLRSKQSEALAWSESMHELLQTKPVDLLFDKDISDLNNRIIILMKGKGEFCPEIQKECVIYSDNKRQQMTDAEQRLAQKTKEKEEYLTKMVEFEAKLNALGEKPTFSMSELEHLEKKISDYDILNVEKTKLTTQISSFQGEIDVVKKDVGKKQDELDGLVFPKGELETLRRNLAEMEVEEAATRDRYSELQRKLIIATEAKKRLTENKKKIAELKKEFDSLREDAEGMAMLKEAFSPNGIKAIIIDMVIPRLEDKINKILGQLSDFSVQLDTQKSGLSGDTTIEGLFITIYNEQGESFDYNNYSGGEKLKITVAISEALSELQATGFRVLDELFIGLDEDSTESFVKILGELQSRFSQFLCISHLPNIKDLFENKITAVKNNGITNIIT